MEIPYLGPKPRIALMSIGLSITGKEYLFRGFPWHPPFRVPGLAAKEHVDRVGGRG